ncbi:MAG: DUF3224 domain-containing protein [Steroidobacteraceae bacterium]
MKFQAKGTFDVAIKPQHAPVPGPGAALGRMSLDKKFHGDLTGGSKGEMLTAVTETKGSAGYVAVERVTGNLNGRKGSFVLQHAGIMNRGAPQLAITVVPDSGTDELTGIMGLLKIDAVEGTHHYQFDYTLPK